MIVELVFGSLRLGPLRVLSDRRERFNGLRGATGGGVLLFGRSVHTIGMRAPIGAVFLDRRGRVLAGRKMKPGRVHGHWRARLIAEVPPGHRLPAVGEEAVAYALEDAGPTRSLCDSDRKPG